MERSRRKAPPAYWKRAHKSKRRTTDQKLPAMCLPRSSAATAEQSFVEFIFFSVSFFFFVDFVLLFIDSGNVVAAAELCMRFIALQRAIAAAATAAYQLLLLSKKRRKQRRPKRKRKKRPPPPRPLFVHDMLQVLPGWH